MMGNETTEQYIERNTVYTAEIIMITFGLLSALAIIFLYGETMLQWGSGFFPGF